jgi:hypothetical protein
MTTHATRVSRERVVINGVVIANGRAWVARCVCGWESVHTTRRDAERTATYHKGKVSHE